ncbi:solute carrier family 39 (zinc transporter), member 1/2/3 [Nematocida sp. AWRm77]|nr:solute carrier family 39 (zinc transporter), member 1/2/3 [Nematocida sp. AWRm77]
MVANIGNSMFVKATWIFAASFFPSLFPSAMLSSKKLRQAFNKVNIISTGLLLAILFVDFIPHMVEEKCGGGHVCGEASGAKGFFGKAVDVVKDSHMGLIVAGLTFIGLILIDKKIIKHSHCHGEEQGRIEESARKPSVQSHAVSNSEIGMCCTEGLMHTTTAKQAIVFIFVFSIHSLFEGLAVTDDIKGNVMFYGLLVHKVMESITVGIALFSSKFSKRVCVGLLLFYSIFTPAGMIIASYVSQWLNNWLVREIFMGLSFGSLSFIVQVEMLPPIVHSLNSIQKILLMLAGYIVGTILIGAVHNHSHGHGSSHNHGHGHAH